MFFRLLLVLALTILPTFAFAEEEVNVEGVLVADISVYEPTILSNENGLLKVGFILANNGNTAQGDIRYGIDVIRTDVDGGQTIVDSFVPNETLALAPHESQTKELTYTIPPALSGEYDIWVISKTTSGLMLGLGNGGKATFTGADSYIEIAPDSCVIKVSGETDTYTLLQGVDIAEDETLSLACTLVSHAPESITVTPSFETHRRTMYGEGLDTVAVHPQTITLKAGEQKTVDIAIPHAVAPQAYDVAVGLIDTTSHTLISNKIIAHYVLQGGSATIQNVVFDKGLYTQGDTLSAYLFWTPSADSFDDSRQGTGTVLTTTTLTMHVRDIENTPCITPITQTLAADQSEITVQAPVIANCVAPTASVIITDATGTVLDTRTFASPVVEIEKEVTNPTPAPQPLPFWSFRTVSILLVTLSSLIILFVVVRMIRNNQTVSATLLKSLILFVFITSGLVGGVVEAVTWSTTYTTSSTNPFTGVTTVTNHIGITFTVNADKAIYNTNEGIALSTVATSNYCANANDTYTITINLVGNAQRVVSGGMRGMGTHYSSASLIAPSAPGSYNITLRGCDTYGRCANKNLPITVIAPAQCTGTTPGNATLCTGDDTGLSADTGRTLLPFGSTCTIPTKCEYTCNAGYYNNAGTCTLAQCTGSIPGNASALGADESSNLSVSTAWAQASSDTGAKCEFSCNGGYTWNGTSCDVVVVTPPNSATCGVLTAPASVTTGQTFSATVGMNNVGTATWTSASNYNLGSQNPQDNNTWGTGRVGLPANVAPGQAINFTRNFTAPATPGVYPFTWRMVQDGVEWFGNTCTQNITVSAPVAPALTLSADTPIWQGGNSTLTWNVAGTADSCWASNGWSGWKTFSSGEHTEVVTPGVTTTYDLECWNQGVSSGKKSATVVVNVPVCTNSIPANASICTGDDTGLGVNTARTLVGSCGAPKCEYTCNQTHTLSGGVCVPKPSCSNTLDDDGDGATDSADSGCTSDTDTDEVNPSGSFTSATPSSSPAAPLDSGSTVALSWTTQHTTGCTVQVTENNSTINDVWTNITNGTRTTSPLHINTQYILACGSIALDSINLYATATPELTGTPLRVPQGENVTLRWDTHNNNESLCTLTTQGSATNLITTTSLGPDTGTRAVPVNAQTTYTLSCPNPQGGAPLTDSVVIEIVPIGFET